MSKFETPQSIQERVAASVNRYNMDVGEAFQDAEGSESVDAWEVYGDTCDRLEKELVQTLVSLLRDLIAEGKPEKRAMGGEVQRRINGKYNQALDEYEQSLINLVEGK